MYSLGQPVFAMHEDEWQLGEVVRVLSSPHELLYDVSVEAVVLKCIDETAMRPASAADLRAHLTAHTNMQIPVLTNAQGIRRHRYAQDLARMLANAEKRQRAQEHSDSIARFEVGDPVVFDKDDGLAWGFVQAAFVDENAIRYVVDALGEQMQLDEDRLRVPGQEKIPDHVPGLGSRVRFLTAGHEDDDEFLGRVCMVKKEVGDWVVSMVFDDGDVFEGLATADVVAVPES